MKAIYAKLLLFQKNVVAVEKDSLNPFLKNRYADINQFLATIKPILSEVGLILLQPLITTEDGRAAIKTIVADPESSESIESIVPLMESSTAQQFGSVVSYTRRYSLQSLLALETTDDDGNSASEIKTITKTICTTCKKEFEPKPSFVKICKECTEPFGNKVK